MFSYIVLFTSHFWSLFTQMAPYLVLGFLVAGLLAAFISDAFVERHLGSNGFAGIIKASVIGVPLPLCSCGIIPVAASLYRQGASRASTVSFLISTPQTGVDSIMVTWSFMGPFFAFYRVIISFCSGILGGTLISALIKGVSPSTPVTRSIPRSVPRWKKFKKTALVELPRDIAKALLVGLALGAVLSIFLEPGQLNSTPLSSWGGMVLALFIGLPLYVCATGSIPIATALVAAGFSPGAALVFLMTGPATNMATITTIAKTLGRRTVVLYLLTIVFSSLASGVVFDLFFKEFIEIKEMHHSMEEGVGFIEIISSVLLAALLLPTFIARKKKSCCMATASSTPPRKKMRFAIVGMHCGGCANGIARTLRNLEGVHEVEVDFATSLAKLQTELASVKVIESIEKLGYKASLH